MNLEEKYEKLKSLLTGDQFRKTMKKAGTNKYRISKATGIPYQTLSNWEAGRYKPSIENAFKAGKFLGLVAKDEKDILELKQVIDEAQGKLDQIEGGI